MIPLLRKRHILSAWYHWNTPLYNRPSRYSPSRTFFAAFVRDEATCQKVIQHEITGNTFPLACFFPRISVRFFVGFPTAFAFHASAISESFFHILQSHAHLRPVAVHIRRTSISRPLFWYGILPAVSAATLHSDLAATLSAVLISVFLSQNADKPAIPRWTDIH